jgi:ribose transport system permease protein
MIVYALRARLAAAAGMLLPAWGGTDSSIATTYLFTIIAAAVIGGTPLTGGRGGYGRTAAGCFVVTVVALAAIDAEPDLSRRI